MSPARAHQEGFALVSAIFLITVLFLLGAYLVGLRTSQSSAATLDLLGMRAYSAARSAIEWAAYDSLRNGLCSASTTLTFGGTLSDFTATVTCTRTTYAEASTVTVDAIVATACNQPAASTCPNASPGVNYVERQLAITVSP
jgi:MSHA biogenesis protein MshP